MRVLWGERKEGKEGEEKLVPSTVRRSRRLLFAGSGQALNEASDLAIPLGVECLTVP